MVGWFVLVAWCVTSLPPPFFFGLEFSSLEPHLCSHLAAICALYTRVSTLGHGFIGRLLFSFAPGTRIFLFFPFSFLNFGGVDS